MNTTQQPEALNLEEFRAKVTHAAREPLLARIAELEAQLSAIGAGGVEPLRKRAALAATPAADAGNPVSESDVPVVLPEPALEILEDAVSILSSINHGKQHAVKVGDEVCYWQRQEWIDWAEKEVLPKLRALLATGGQAQAVERANRDIEAGNAFRTDAFTHWHPLEKPALAAQAKQGGA